MPCRQSREVTRQATIMSPAGKVPHRNHSLPKKVTMKPFCNTAANDTREKMTMKNNMGKEGIFSSKNLFRPAPTPEGTHPQGKQNHQTNHPAETRDSETPLPGFMQKPNHLHGTGTPGFEIRTTAISLACKSLPAL